VIPIVETLTTYHVRIEEYTMSATPGEGVKAMIDDSIMVLTKDGQDATWDVTIRYQAGPEPYRVVELHRTIGPNYREIIVRPMVREALRTVAKEFEAMESFAAAREEIARMAEERIGADFEQKCLRLDKVLIRKIELPPALADAIRAKKVAEQKALEMEYVLDRERKEAERKVIEAKGRGDAQVAEAERRAKAIRVLQEELAQSPEYIKYLAVEKLADDVTVILLPEHAEAIIPLEGLGKR
jgi:regulator of protease activity HflC (stomatin/prohibitin superfamily)